MATPDHAVTVAAAGDPAPAGPLREVAAGEWDALLGRLGITDVYLRHAYLESACLLEPGAPVMLHLAAGDVEVVYPFILRDVPHAPEARDIITPYGYGGPVVAAATGTIPDPATRDSALASFHAAADGWYADRRVVSTFVRFHPLLGTVANAHPQMQVTELAPTVAWRTGGDHDLLESMHSRHRRLVRKAARAGVAVRAAEAGDVGGASLDAFRELYELTMRRQQAAPFYLFADAYWQHLAGPLAPHVVLFEAVLDGDVIAALLCLDGGTTLHYHLGASADAARTIGASNLCFLEAARRARAHGRTHLHLGGGVGGSVDSLHEFKHRFDPAPEALAPFHVGRQVHDPARYRELAGTDATDGFFPAYRAPTAAATDA